MFYAKICPILPNFPPSKPTLLHSCQPTRQTIVNEKVRENIFQGLCIHLTSISRCLESPISTFPSKIGVYHDVCDFLPPNHSAVP